MKSEQKNFKRLLVCLILFITVIAYPSWGSSDKRIFSDSGEFGAVSTGHPLATNAAIKILQNGGNAVDAGVCAALMLGVTDFTNSGLGGDAFTLVHLPNGSILAFDASSRKPRAFARNDADIGLPTEPELLLKLLRQFGSRSRVEIFKPAIETCIEGFYVTAYLNQVIRKKLAKLSDPAAIEFLAPNGHARPDGSIVKQPQLAITLMQMAKDNGRSFYSGKGAEAMIAHINSLGSSYSREDFSLFRSQVSRPIKYEWQNYALYGTPPPSSSVAAIKFTEKLLASKMHLFPRNAKDLIKIAKLGREIIDFKYNNLSSFVGDPDGFYQGFDNNEANQSHLEMGDPNTHTTHLCVWDKNGMAVSMTLTLGSHCGSGHLSPLGFFYNNEMKNFKPIVAKYPGNYPSNAGPVSSKAPIMIMKDGKLFSIIGGAGSDRIIFNVGLVAARLISGCSDHAAAVNDPRFFLDYKGCLQHEWSANLKLNSHLERVFPMTKLRESGADYFGLVTMICKTGNLLKAVADFRRDGSCKAVKEKP